MTTMRDVAREAGVSTMTVSNVVNNRPGVGERTRSRVLEAVALLGYEMNVTARQLRVGRTDTLAMFVPTLEGAFFSGLATRLTRLARNEGYHLAVESLGATAEDEHHGLDPARLRHCDGAIVYVVHMSVEEAARLDYGVPVVFLGERSMPPDFDHVMMDNVNGARLATRQLLDRGARRIALLAGEPDPGAAGMGPLRTRGYRGALHDAGVAVDPRLIVPARTFGMADGFDAVRGLLNEGVAFDGVFALTDTIAMGALRALADAGMSVPDDVQVVGWDNITEAAFAIPRLSTIDPGVDAIADAVMELLISRMAGSEPSGPRVRTPAAAEFIARESTV